MVSLFSKPIEVTAFKRPCLWHDISSDTWEPGLFHRWADEAWTHGAAVTVGGFPAGQIWKVVALVETEDGHIRRVHPESVRFTDTAYYMDGYAWRVDKDGR